MALVLTPPWDLTPHIKWDLSTIIRALWPCSNTTAEDAVCGVPTVKSRGIDGIFRSNASSVMGDSRWNMDMCVQHLDRCNV